MKKSVLSAMMFSAVALLIMPAQSQTVVPLYAKGNVLAVGIYNDSPTSSDLIGSAELSDNNGVIYVDGALGNGPGNATFKHKVVFFDNGTGAEEPGWQQRDFDDSSWKSDTTGNGFPIGMGTSSEVGRYDIEVLASDETIYTRSIFDVADPSSVAQLVIKIAGDDAAVAWINGVFIGLAGHENSDGGETPPNFKFNTGIASGSFGAWDGGDPFAFTGTGTAQFTVQVEPQQSAIPIFSSGNVLAVGIYNDSPTSSDLIGGAQVSGNNGVVYVDNALGNGPGDYTFKHKIVFFDNGTGAEEPGWQQPAFNDSSWKTDTTGNGFPIGMGTSSEVGRYDIEVLASDETIYTRSTFNIANPSSVTQLTIKLAGDDAAVAWLNGVFIGLAGHELSDGGETPENFKYNTGIASGSFGAWDGGDPFAFTGTGTASFTVNVSAQTSSVENWELMK